MKPKPFSALNHLTVPVAIKPSLGPKGCPAPEPATAMSENYKSLRVTCSAGFVLQGNQTATCDEPSMRGLGRGRLARSLFPGLRDAPGHPRAEAREPRSSVR